jgi:sortase (surface protein transpeptidase)
MFDEVTSMKQYSRRSALRLLSVPAGAFALAAVMPNKMFAQDDNAADDVPGITSNQQGEMPTSGGARPGPSTPLTAPAQPIREGVMPVSIRIEKAEVDAVIETREIIDGVMQDPTGPWVVSWYQETPKAGGDGNTVMAGHIDYWNVGPAVFYNIRDLVDGDVIEVYGEDNRIYSYRVNWVREYLSTDLDLETIQEIVGPTTQRSLTLITCGGQFDYASGEYLSRLAVRSHLQGSRSA